jgi:DNA polymerase-3 subunit epsilon
MAAARTRRDDLLERAAAYLLRRGVAGLSLRPAAAARSDIVIEVRERIAVSRLTDAEREAHLAFIAGLGAGAIWREYVEG